MPSKKKPTPKPRRKQAQPKRIGFRIGSALMKAERGFTMESAEDPKDGWVNGEVLGLGT